MSNRLNFDELAPTLETLDDDELRLVVGARISPYSKTLDLEAGFCDVDDGF
jgi:hypothetical protein